MNNSEPQEQKKSAKYADSSISDKAFKRAIIWFCIYCTLFIVGVIFMVNADGLSMG
ncbi:hypothetical protein [Acinetobacter rudis]|uniref:Uncharacterized protein n=1 Tax=Acinetobacter rudis TaxID=632955 RepID=A0AAW8J8C9_9GAMM|nr:hypothetical protein [Acinetobacter rudis]MDQ8935343.1 hypothetical protein [Acinetobacter rudis]MDQ8952347.1 hypothetical protein [Acinetobacter rudis]MDQ9017606.1 hypothetical protein [Acinetobacter rudis]